MALTEELRALDKKHLWHPFTQMEDWCSPENDPLVLLEGKGVYLWDSDGNRYLDGNSSIWTNIHGHRHPHIDAAIVEQTGKLAHCSALGYSNGPSIRLAEKLTSFFPAKTLSRVFFTDDGSTAIECACKMAIQYRQLTGEPGRTRFLSFDHAYHGDTAGAASLGGIGSFTDRFQGTGFQAKRIPDIEALDELGQDEISKLTAVCIEPVIQGAAGMKTWPDGTLTRLRAWCDRHDVFLILDEVMTGFGRTGKMFGCQHEDIVPDFLCLAKGLTGGYLPLAATLTTGKVFSAFLGGYEETFFYGHSYCANPLGCAVALANLEVFEIDDVLGRLDSKIDFFRKAIKEEFEQGESVADIRLAGLIAGIDIGPFPPDQFAGTQVCLAAREHGLLTRPVRDTLVLMPPLCATEPEIAAMVSSLGKAFRQFVNND